MKNDKIVLTIVIIVVLSIGAFVGLKYMAKDMQPQEGKLTVIKDTPEATREAAIQKRMDEIRKDPTYMDAVRADAKKKGISINEALIQSATYSVDHLTGY